MDPRLSRVKTLVAVPAVAIAAAMVLLAACGASAPSAAVPSADPSTDKLAQIQARGTLVGYAETDYPPQSMLVEGASRPSDTKCLPNQRTSAELTGFDNETTKLVAKDLRVEACFVTPPWAEVVAGNWGDRWDIVYGSGSINSDRMKRLYMTQPYYATPNLFFVRKDSAFQTAEELSGLKVGSCSSCSHEFYLKHTLEIPGVTLEWDIENPQIVGFETEGPGLQALADGEIDAFLCAAPVGQAQIEAGLPLRALAKPAFTFFPSGFIDKSSGLDVVAFTSRVNEIIRAHQADGSLEAVSMEWFKKDYVTEAANFDLVSIGQTVP